ncbi:hypothetical protein [Bradyrhizobium sp.]|uniref:hypothetical protein n=1 Tax=Bradyrhizobium sp. TaxID=376 RepID=UPI002623B6F7|nr:hypothetical protein [Bradyrhizobium sp.]
MPLNRNRKHSLSPALLLAVLLCLICTSIASLAQSAANLVPENWRPKDGKYIEAGTEFAGPCEDAPGFLVELSKRAVGIDELEKCRVTSFTDTAPGVFKINMTCSERKNSGYDGLKNYREVMTLRKINDQSFFMHMTDKGKFPRQEWRVNYCPSPAADTNALESTKAK